MYIKKNKSVALVHKILRIKGNPQCCSFVFAFVLFRLTHFSRVSHLLFTHIEKVERYMCFLENEVITK